MSAYNANDIQIEEGTATAYIPYGKNITFPLGTEKMYEGSTLEDNGKRHLRKHTSVPIGSTEITINDMKENGEFLSSVGGTLSGKTITFASALIEEADIEYELAEPETVAYTGIQQTAYNELQNLETYQYVNNIELVANEETNMTLNYKQDLQTQISSINT